MVACVLTNWLSWVTHTIRFNGESLWTHPNSIHSSVTDQSSRSLWITERNATSTRLNVCLKKPTFAFLSTRHDCSMSHFDTVPACDRRTDGRAAKTHARVFFDSFFVVRLWLNDTTYSKIDSKGTNRNMPARNTLVQLLALYTNPESHNAQSHRQTDGRHVDANSRAFMGCFRVTSRVRFFSDEAQPLNVHHKVCKMCILSPVTD